ncbi:MAG: hypothetical protein A3B99_02755 [Candidatus Yanofskybacteria bacterium RIFCSPHIGHO2_02_FULL_44_12b]|uniref:Uncharacterized protein n=2 Tax=Candidatus Yanofskyibacteriota TaxID=1752733 RepID=A0A1F8GLQ9_9BACT|nr:MAG: Protein containing Heat shock protein Hsp20 protein [Candidatus Yanofskybacteria bacterium GW2011_GWA2_44_9]OGN05030.1 MAG: hypothetical protein A2659_02660 [Candidatus Yanofskybacteria bacterium RIFCSPHIGHO2_01_FULL_44_24]OGN16211.1 MAG: hypothetical protein A3B99_02755 [Candidatus Yanofskybacteria bacterium RIFCSPHIGHO2_02_FULL_44_12b]OGN26345.1 MAG: hypothetical protein A2925_00435 [Candidatus Yanofskybacteria bacterium RIFCSPLOWO2_01_FULL_44_22]
MDDYSLEQAVKKTAPPDDEGQLTVDIFQTDKEIVIQSTIAGVDPNNIDISITKSRVTIRGHRESSEKIDSSDFYHQEIYWGSFSRSIILPVDIDPDRSRASMKNGILTVRLPKLTGKRP